MVIDQARGSIIQWGIDEKERREKKAEQPEQIRNPSKPNKILETNERNFP